MASHAIAWLPCCVSVCVSVCVRVIMVAWMIFRYFLRRALIKPLTSEGIPIKFSHVHSCQE